VNAPKKPRRSKDTPQRILVSARRLFALHGFERTTIRAVAADAEIDPAMVMRYYGSKTGLFAAAAQHDLQLPDLMQVPRNEIGQRLVRHFLARWEGPNAGDELPLLLRAAATSPAAVTRMHDIFKHQLMPAVAAVTSPKQSRHCAALIATQMVGLGFTRYVVRVPAVVALPSSVIIDQVGATIQRYIDFGES
jgi:AcrR family transcriptional regulator